MGPDIGQHEIPDVGADFIAGLSRGQPYSGSGLFVESRRADFASPSEARAIQGLRLTMTGLSCRTLLKDRIRSHRDRARRWKREEGRTPEEATEDEPLLPTHMCGNEAERHEWRAEVLRFIH